MNWRETRLKQTQKFWEKETIFPQKIGQKMICPCTDKRGREGDTTPYNAEKSKFGNNRITIVNAIVVFFSLQQIFYPVKMRGSRIAVIHAVLHVGSTGELPWNLRSLNLYLSQQRQWCSLKKTQKGERNNMSQSSIRYYYHRVWLVCLQPEATL